MNPQGALARLFSKADRNLLELESALYDPDAKVSLNAMRILMYIALPEGLAAIDRRCQAHFDKGEDCNMPAIELTKGSQYLKRSKLGINAAVLRTLHPDRDADARVVASNYRTKTMIVEVIYGSSFTSGWHVVVREDEKGWRVLSNTLIWES